jgi:hypothetical protein
MTGGAGSYEDVAIPLALRTFSPRVPITIPGRHDDAS